MSDYYATTGESILAEGDDLNELVNAARIATQANGADVVIWHYDHEVAAIVFSDGSVVHFGG